MKQSPPLIVDGIATAVAALLAIGAAAAEFFYRRAAARHPDSLSIDPSTETTTFRTSKGGYALGGNVFSPYRRGSRLLRLSRGTFAATFRGAVRSLQSRKDQ